MIASHNSGTNLDIYCMEILNVYMRLVNDSPMARNRMVTASMIGAGIVSLNLVSHFEIFPSTIWRSSSKSLEFILVKFLNPIPSSSFNFSKRLTPPQIKFNSTNVFAFLFSLHLIARKRCRRLLHREQLRCSLRKPHDRYCLWLESRCGRAMSIFSHATVSRNSR